jgi:hypothetical protein
MLHVLFLEQVDDGVVKRLFLNLAIVTSPILYTT